MAEQPPADITAAVEESARRHWEWFRDAYDLYMLDSGVPGEDPVMPRWEDLSELSQRMVVAASGMALMSTADVAFALSEVST